MACDDDDNGDATATSAASPAASATAAGDASPTPDAQPTGELPAIVVEEPGSEEILRVPFEVSGTANVFEAALTVQILTTEGELVCEHNIMATSGSGTRGDFSTVMAFVPPEPPAGQAAVPMTLRALSYSPMDGSEENIVSLDINVSGELPDIVVESPACGATFESGQPITAAGTAQVFEGTVLLEIVDVSGNVVASTFTTAASGVERAPWSATITPPAPLDPGTYRLVAYSESAMDGSRENEFPVPIIVNLE